MSYSQKIKLLNNLVRSQDRRKFYSANTNKNNNTYKCPEHNEFFSKICLNCNLDICTKCEKKHHYNHIIIKYDDIIPDSSEIENLKNNINIYINRYNNLKNEINNWFIEIKNKLNDFDNSLKSNEIINSRDFIANYSNNKICLNNILKFRKIYYNIMEENNVKNKNIISTFNKYGIIDNINFPLYYDYIEIQNILNKLIYYKENLVRKSELILNYLISISMPYLGGGSNNSTSNFNINNNETLSKSSSYYNNTFKSPFNRINMNSNDIQFVDALGEKGQGVNNYNYNSNSDKRIYDSKTNEFKNILNKTKIPEFNLNNNPDSSKRSYKTYSLCENNNYSLKSFAKYLNKMNIGNTITNNLKKENTSQDLLNKSSFSIKSTKIVPSKSYRSSINIIEKKNTSNTLGIKSSLLPNNFLTKENKEVINKEKETEIEKENQKKIYLEKTTQFNNKNAQIKTYVHKKFNNNKIEDNKKNNYNIKFQKKIIIINKSNRHSNNLQNELQKDKIKETPKIFNKNEINDINSEIDKEGQKYHTLNHKNNGSLIDSKVYRIKQTNDEILKDNESTSNNCTSPIKPEMLKNAIIGSNKKKIVNKNNEINEKMNNNICTNENNNLLRIVYSPSLNRNPNITMNIKKNNNNNNNNNDNDINDINYQTYKINNTSTNITITPPSIIKTNKNSSFFVDPEKDIDIGLELGNSDCKVGIVNQNTGEIQLVCFGEDKYSIPTLVSFGEIKKEIKIGYKALEDICANPSQTIFNILKFFGKKYNDVKGRKELWPFKIYYTSDNDDNKPYLKINFGPKKDKIFYFENILSIFLVKLFDIVFRKVNLENSSNCNSQKKIKNKGDENESYIKNNLTVLNISLVLTVPNYFSYCQRKLIEKIFRDVIFPCVNDSYDNEGLKTYGQYKINMINLRIENASSIASLCLNMNYDYNNNLKNNNILILNIDGGSINTSITSSYNENDKPIYKVKAFNGIPKGGIDLVDDFMFEILDKFDKKVKKKILDSPFALIKLRKICEKIRINLLSKESDMFNIGDILDKYNEQIEIKRSDYDKSSSYFYNKIRTLIYDCLNSAKMKERDINDLLFIGDICKDKKLVQMIESSFIQDNNFLFEKLIYSSYMDNEKDFYIVGGAAYYSTSSGKNNNNNLYSFNDISPFNIGIQKYNGNLDYIIMKGEKIPMKNRKTIKIENIKELNIFEQYEENENNNNILIGKIKIDGDTWMNNIKYGYKELKIEYEINDKLEIIIRLYNGEIYGKEKKVRLI